MQSMTFKLMEEINTRCREDTANVTTSFNDAIKTAKQDYDKRMGVIRQSYNVAHVLFNWIEVNITNFTTDQLLQFDAYDRTPLSRTTTTTPPSLPIDKMTLGELCGSIDKE